MQSSQQPRHRISLAALLGAIAPHRSGSVCHHPHILHNDGWILNTYQPPPSVSGLGVMFIIYKHTGRSFRIHPVALCPSCLILCSCHYANILATRCRVQGPHTQGAHTAHSRHSRGGDEGTNTALSKSAATAHDPAYSDHRGAYLAFYKGRAIHPC